MEFYYFQRVYFPYCLERLKDGRYIVLNRLYKPLGVAAKAHVDYAAHPTAASIEITEALAKRLSWKGDGDLSRIYLHDGDTVLREGGEGWNEYAARLLLLAGVHVNLP